jgi:membrane protein YdbS with pleckstrin-like domain
MYELLRRVTLSFLKVPAEPHPPVGDPASLRVFRAGRNYLKLRMATWGLAQLIALAAFAFWTAILIGVETKLHEQKAASNLPSLPVAADAPTASEPSAQPTTTSPPAADPPNRNWIERGADKIRSTAETIAAKYPAGEKPKGVGDWIAGYTQFFVELALLLPGWVFSLLWIVKLVSFGIYLLQIPITYAVRRLDYEMRWYMVTDRSLRLRHGVWKVTESTMSFANIQQVVMIEGPLQRLLGLSDVRVQSAGGGRSLHEHQKAGDDMHVGLFRHVTNAPEIRDLILDRLRRFRESGLGDPEEKPTPLLAAPGSTNDATLAAARELLAEAKALRAVLN